MNQEDLTSENVSVSYISRIETGDVAYPSMEALVAIAARLNTSALFLATGDTKGCPYCGR